MKPDFTSDFGLNGFMEYEEEEFLDNDGFDNEDDFESFTIPKLEEVQEQREKEKTEAESSEEVPKVETEVLSEETEKIEVQEQETEVQEHVSIQEEKQPKETEIYGYDSEGNPLQEGFQRVEQDSNQVLGLLGKKKKTTTNQEQERELEKTEKVEEVEPLESVEQVETSTETKLETEKEETKNNFPTITISGIKDGNEEENKLSEQDKQRNEEQGKHIRQIIQNGIVDTTEDEVHELLKSQINQTVSDKDTQEVTDAQDSFKGVFFDDIDNTRGMTNPKVETTYVQDDTTVFPAIFFDVRNKPIKREVSRLMKDLRLGREIVGTIDQKFALYIIRYTPEGKATLGLVGYVLPEILDTITQSGVFPEEDIYFYNSTKERVKKEFYVGYASGLMY